MSKLSDALRDMRVFSDHALLVRFGVRGKTDVCLIYYPAVPRSVQPSKTSVYSPSHRTKPDAAWYNNGCKTFVGTLRVSMPKAMAWATERYGIERWVNSPFGRSSKVPKAVLDAARRAVREAAQAAPQGQGGGDHG